MSDKVLYREKLSSIDEIPAPDDLVSGTAWKADRITVSTEGEYQRGMLMMSSSEGFVKATAEGAALAPELCILAEDITVEAGKYVETAGYFTGTFRYDRVIAWEDAEPNAVRTAMRMHGMFVS